jgi:hypothetical protein
MSNKSRWLRDWQISFDGGFKTSYGLITDGDSYVPEGARVAMGINNWLILSTRLVEFVDSLAFEQEILIDEFHVSVVCLAVDAGSAAS